jgi:hypothetical protein
MHGYGKEYNMAHEVNSAGNLLPEYFHSPTPEVQSLFLDTVHGLRHDFYDQATTKKQRVLSSIFGNADEYYVHVHCSLEELAKPAEPVINTTTLSVAFIKGTALAIDGAIEDVSEESLLIQREFEEGCIYGEMTDADYEEAVWQLQNRLDAKEWAWIEAARQYARHESEAEFTPFAIHELFDTKPPRLGVLHTEEQWLDGLEFKNGTSLRIVWLEANEENIRKSSEDLKLQVRLDKPGEGEYMYFRFLDDTEQMVVEAEDAKARAALTAQGYAALDKNSDDSWATVGPSDRRNGVQAPTNNLMMRFAAELCQAKASGIKTAAAG